MAITEKQRRFADYYVANGNGADAYRRAYGVDKNAKQSAAKLLQKRAITALVIKKNEEAARLRHDEVIITRADIKRQILKDIKDARDVAQPRTAMQGWVIIARLCGIWHAPPPEQLTKLWSYNSVLTTSCLPPISRKRVSR